MKAMDSIASIKNLNQKTAAAAKKVTPMKMTDEYKKQVKLPTYMAEDYSYLADKQNKLSKDFDKRTVFKTKEGRGNRKNMQDELVKSIDPQSKKSSSSEKDPTVKIVTEKKAD